MSNRAWVTLATNDSYGLGALVLAHSLRRVGSVHPAAILITPAVTEAMRNRLSAVFGEVITVDVLDSKDDAHLALLQRPELGITFTKIHCWSLTQYEKCVFLDADILVVQNCDELFDREELSAAPDVGWPDCFNSGVFVFKPSKDTFASLIKFAQDRGSFDGGDQGLLNSFFSDWAHGDINKHLPFLYNVTSAAFYSYLPALKHYGQNLKIIHFIGAAKPWLQHYNWESHSVDAPGHLKEFLQLWWDLFVGQVHPQLDVGMVDEEAQSEVEETLEYEPENVAYYAPEVNPASEFSWHHPVDESEEMVSSEEKLDMSQFYDPWEHHRGIIPPGVDAFAYKEIEAKQKEFVPLHEESQSWDVSQSNQWSAPNENDWYSDHNKNINNQQWHNDANHDNISDHHHVEHHTINDNYIPQQTTFNYYQSQNEHFDHNSEFVDDSRYSESIPEIKSHFTSTTNQSPYYDKSFSHISIKRKVVVQVYHVHMDHRKVVKHSKKKSPDNAATNGDVSDAESEDFIIPRHPYDGFYLRHRATIDTRGHKICTHQVPAFSPKPLDSSLLTEPEKTKEVINKSNNVICNDDNSDHTGVAGNLAKVVPGASVSQRDALDELSRRQGWEAGNIDYMGADSFDNIWAKISKTLNETAPPQAKEPSPPPKEPTPPPKEPTPPPKEPTPAPKEPTPVPKEPTPPPKEPTPPTKEPTPPLKEPTPSPIEPTPLSKEPTPPAKEPTPAKESEPISLEDETSVAVAVEEPIIPAPVVEAFAEILREASVNSAEVVATVPRTPPATPIKSSPEPSTPVTEPDALLIAPTEEQKIEAPIAEDVPTQEPNVEETKTEPAKAEESPIVAKVEEISVEAAAVVDAPVEVQSEVAASPVSATEGPVAETTPVKSEGTLPELSDSPPLASTPSSESPLVPAAKLEERRKPVSKLLLPSAGVADALPTPDSEFEDAATLAQSIIASELATPTVSSPSPVSPASPPAPRDPEQLAPTEPEVPTPPIGGSVSLAQIGVKPSKVSCAEQIKSSITGQEESKPEAGSEPTASSGAPKKKVVKKVAKKEGDVPVPPPRKKEKKPKDK